MQKISELFEQDLDTVLEEIKTVLIEKNRKYGDAALSPIQVFSKQNAENAIRVRIDDKINRILNAQDDDTEDAEFDLLGYLILLRISQKRK